MRNDYQSYQQKVDGRSLKKLIESLLNGYHVIFLMLITCQQKKLLLIMGEQNAEASIKYKWTGGVRALTH